MSAQTIGRRLLFGGAFGALALTAPRAAQSDTSFTNFGFPATGAPRARTMPDRLAEIKNVKDYGATGNGGTDDTVAIQAAINAAMAAGSHSQGVDFGCDVFFPPGIYKTSAALNDGSGGNASVRLIGSGKHCCAIIGKFQGYIIDKQNNSRQTIEAIEGLYIKNSFNGTGGGGIRFCAAETGTIRRCYIQAFNAIDASANPYCTIISDCTILSAAPAGTAGTVGIYAAQVGIYNCSVVGYDVGVQGYNVGLVIHGSRFEVNNTGILIGKDRSGATSQLSGFSIQGNSTERNNTAIVVLASAGGIIAGNAITGVVSLDGLSTPEYGIRVFNGDGLVFAGNIISCWARVAGIDISDVSGSNIAFEACFVGIGSGTGVPWRMPTKNQGAFSFTNCNNPSAAFPFASLPPRPVEGMEFNITDSNTATWGAAVGGGGSNHVKCRYNGSAWTVVGK